MVEQGICAVRRHGQSGRLTPALRAERKGQSLVVWLTGRPGSGKSTIANIVQNELGATGRQTMLLDGDNLRRGLNADLGSEPAAQSENVRRVGELAKLMVDAGLVVIVALGSPRQTDRTRAAALLPEGQFLEILVDASVETCQRRDQKSLGAKAERGVVIDLTGRDQPYEPPEDPALVLRTEELTAEEAARQVVELVLEFSRH